MGVMSGLAAAGVAGAAGAAAGARTKKKKAQAERFLAGGGLWGKPMAQMKEKVLADSAAGSEPATAALRRGFLGGY